MLMITVPSHFVTVLEGATGEMVPENSAFHMPGGRDQLCHLPSPGIRNQPGVQGEAGQAGRCILVFR